MRISGLIDLINSYKPDLVILSLPYQNLTIMDACLACGVKCYGYRKL